MSDRLNQTMRDEIIKRLIAHRFQATLDEHTRREFELAEAVYSATYNGIIQEKMNGLPKGWLEESSEIRLTFGGRNSHAQFQDEKPRRFLSEHMRWGEGNLAFPATSPLTKQFHSLERDKELIRVEMTDVRNQVRAQLRHFTTIKKLRKEWPQIEQFTQGLGTTPMLPALPLQKLNDMLGLSSN